MLPHELVICDDGSTDKTIEIVKEFATTAPFPVRLFRNEKQLGYAENFFKAAKLCKGQWIAFSDQDDVWMKNKIFTVSSVIERYKNRNLLLVSHSSWIADEFLNKSGIVIPSAKRDRLSRARNRRPFSFWNGFCITFNSCLVAKYNSSMRFISPTTGKPTGHDNWISMLSNALGSCYYIATPLAIWRRHDTAFTTAELIRKALRSVSVKDFNRLPTDTYSMAYAAESAETAALATALERIEEHETNGTMRKKLVDATFDLRSREVFLRRRSSLYKSRSLRTRAKQYGVLIVSGAYCGPEFKALPIRSLVKDFVVACGWRKKS